MKMNKLQTLCSFSGLSADENNLESVEALCKGTQRILEHIGYVFEYEIDNKDAKVYFYNRYKMVEKKITTVDFKSYASYYVTENWNAMTHVSMLSYIIDDLRYNLNKYTVLGNHYDHTK